MTSTKILLIDDEHDILEIIEYNLQKEGYEVFTADNGEEGIRKAKEIIPDVILLDVMMPEKDGIEVCRELRKMESLSDTLIIFLSARAEEFAQLAAYETGADDYIIKIIKPKVLISKIKALLNLRSSSLEKKNLIEIGTITIDKNNFCVMQNGEKFFLPRKEFDLLLLLASHSQRVFTRDEILKKVWGEDAVVGDRTIDVHIRRIREKLGDNIIQTLKGIGYKLIA